MTRHDSWTLYEETWGHKIQYVSCSWPVVGCVSMSRSVYNTCHDTLKKVCNSDTLCGKQSDEAVLLWRMTLSLWVLLLSLDATVSVNNRSQHYLDCSFVLIETSLAGLSVSCRSLRSLRPPAESLPLSWLFLKEKFYEGVVEIIAHYSRSDLTSEMKLTVAGIRLPAVVLMMTFVSQSHICSNWATVISARWTRFTVGVALGWLAASLKHAADV